MGETFHLTIVDLPYDFPAADQGQPGVHRVHDPRTGQEFVAVPRGTVWTRRSSFTSPRFVSRQEQEHLRQAGGRMAPGAVRRSLCKCARCKLLIGAGYHEREVYLEPRLIEGKIKWRTLCAYCATDVGLNHGYCVVSEADWSECEHRAIRDQFKTACAIKQGMLLDLLRSRWPTYLCERVARFGVLRREWYARGSDRRALWNAEFEYWRGYLKAHMALNTQAWWTRNARAKKGCPEDHFLPEVCAVSFHERLFPFTALSVFAAFKAELVPSVWTIHSLLEEEALEKVA